MRIPRLFHPGNLAVGDQVKLSADAFQHSVKALRMSNEQPVCLFNGDGNDYQAELLEVDKRSASARVVAVQNNDSESTVSVHLGQVISRGDRMDFALQKSVELGVAEITPLFSDRCGVKLTGERLEKKQQQWQKVVISACEQCGRSRVPVVHAAQTLANFVQQGTADLKLTLDPYAPLPLRQLTGAEQPASVALLIGPEGGFTEAEVDLAKRGQFKPIRIGPRILRTETAALTALSVIQYELGDLA